MYVCVCVCVCVRVRVCVQMKCKHLLQIPFLHAHTTRNYLRDTSCTVGTPHIAHVTSTML